MIDVFEAGRTEVVVTGLLAQIRYQVFAPTLTTVVGPCSAGCGAVSRDSLRCAACLDAELAQALGVGSPTDYLRAARLHRTAEGFALSAAGCIDAQEIALKRQPSCREEPTS